MLTFTQLLDREYAKKDKRGWDTLYIAIDLHDTISPATYKTNDTLDMYPFCEDALILLSNRVDIKLILWTSSNPDYLSPHKALLEDKGIKFDYFNSNPECPTTETADFDSKFYMNVILDDKAGFDPHNDWVEIYDYFLMK